MEKELQQMLDQKETLNEEQISRGLQLCRNFIQQYLPVHQAVKEMRNYGGKHRVWMVVNKKIEDIKRISNEILKILETIHTQDGLSKIPEYCKTSLEKLVGVRKFIRVICELITAKDLYELDVFGNWQRVTEELTCIILLLNYLDTGSLVSYKECAAAIGVEFEKEKGIHLGIDEYHIGLLKFLTELSRFVLSTAANEDFIKTRTTYEFCHIILDYFGDFNKKNEKLNVLRKNASKDVELIRTVVIDLQNRGILPPADDKVFF